MDLFENDFSTYFCYGWLYLRKVLLCKFNEERIRYDKLGENIGTLKLARVWKLVSTNLSLASHGIMKASYLRG